MITSFFSHRDMCTYRVYIFSTCSCQSIEPYLYIKTKKLLFFFDEKKAIDYNSISITYCHHCCCCCYCFIYSFAALPSITSGLNASYSVPLGDGFSFECAVHGVPIPNVVWFKDEGLVSDVNDTNLGITYTNPASSGVRSILTISEVSFGYRGIYTCLATNSAGSARSTGILSIVG